MTHELILTSVSQGLESDDRGFCPVAESSTLPPQLVMCLKSISDYRHLYTPETDDAVHNPVVYSHLIVPSHESTVHVLSRIADSGIDFQHEHNRLAHHVVFESEEQVLEGPAWILAQSGFHFSQWLTPSVRFIQGRPLPTLTAPPPLSRLQQIDREHQRLDAKKMDPFVGSSSAETTELSPLGNTPSPCWKLLTGDAGWGGVLAATIRSGRSAVLVFRPGTNVLPLFVESLSLLPPAMRWKATFSTYFTHYPEHVACQWKAVPVDSPESQHLREDPTILLIDLTTSLGRAPDGPYVEFARHGAEQSLPENELHADLFEDLPELLDDLSTPLPIPTATSADELLSTIESPSLEESVPPSVMAPPIRIRTSSQKTPNVIGSFLNMKSRGTFYTIFGATFLCVVVLSVVVLDQIFGLGILQSPPGKPNEAASTTTGTGPKAVPQKGNEVSKPDPAAASAEKKRQEEEARQKNEERKRLEQQREKNAEKDREKYAKIWADAEAFLEGFRMPKYLTLNVPDFEDQAPPQPPQPLGEFAPLYRFGPAIEFHVVPLVSDPRLYIVTTPFHSFDKPTPPTDSELEEQMEESSDSDDFPSRFDWSVDGVYANGQRVPLLLLTLTEDGLSTTWQEGASLPQSARTAALLRFGFLRFHAEGVKDPSRIRSIPLFETEMTEPVYPAKVFIDSAVCDIPTPFATEPYKSIFESGDVFYSLRLDVVRPETPPGVNKFDFPETESPARYRIDVETVIDYKRTDDAGYDSFHPISVSFDAVAESGRIQWIDRYADQRDECDNELKSNQTRTDAIGKELNEIQQELLTLGGQPAPELSKRQTDLIEERQNLVRRHKEIEAVLSRLPDAHDKIVKNENFRFEYSLFLVPKVDDDNSEPPLLKSEEIIPIMKSGE